MEKENRLKNLYIESVPKRNRIEKALIEESFTYQNITKPVTEFRFRQKKLNNIVLNIMLIKFSYKLSGEKFVFKLEINIDTFNQRTVRGVILKFEQFNSIKQMEIEIRELRKKLNFAKAHFIHY